MKCEQPLSMRVQKHLEASIVKQSEKKQLMVIDIAKYMVCMLCEWKTVIGVHMVYSNKMAKEKESSKTLNADASDIHNIILNILPISFFRSPFCALLLSLSLILSFYFMKLFFSLSVMTILNHHLSVSVKGSSHVTISTHKCALCCPLLTINIYC